ncbi:putative inorganic phosphate cotransporter [Contarinia nasturtii]|uniref:putative inorganic phosphate cotransporter n=1 Tax=Contarinia nasturtii TaxID=265458 RepID=UPI0012D3BEBB|nr:putative inorganic phosphate cotransporter [Contarinia nasturtii]
MGQSKFAKYFCIPQRIIMAIICFFGISIAYVMRVCLSVAITEMVAKPNHTEIVTESNNSICVADPIMLGSSTGHSDGGEYHWTQEQQGWILSSFYIGYVLTHLPGGVIAQKYGGKWTLGLGILSTAIFTLLTPYAVQQGGHVALIVLRILMGLGEGTTFPALSVLLASWVPEKERSKLGSFVFGGGQIGTVAGNLLSGMILSSYSWPWVFYVFGVISIIWFLIFVCICYSNPDCHPFITKEERDYLESELGQLKRHKHLPATPWTSILTSVPMIALVCAQIGHDWGFYIMVSDLPKYMSEVLQFSIKDNGTYSSLPYLVMWIVSVSTGWLSDFMIGRKFLTITGARKWFTAVAAIFPAIFIVLASYAGCDKMLVVVMFTLAMGFMGTFYPGMKVNPLDLSPNYAGSIMAVTNGIGALTGVAAPVFVGVMTPNSSLTEWRIVFWITFVIFGVTTIIYSIWASAEVQPWNTPKEIKSPGHDDVHEKDKLMIELESIKIEAMNFNE